MTMLRVGDLMTDQIVSIKVDETAERLYEIMDQQHVRHVPVVDDDEVLIGIVSQRDLLPALLALDLGRARNPLILSDYMKDVKVADILTEWVDTISPDDSASDAGKLMLQNKYGCLPVVEDNRLVGIITEADYVRHIVENFE